MRSLSTSGSPLFIYPDQPTGSFIALSFLITCVAFSRAAFFSSWTRTALSMVATLRTLPEGRR